MSWPVMSESKCDVTYPCNKRSKVEELSSYCSVILGASFLPMASSKKRPRIDGCQLKERSTRRLRRHAFAVASFDA